MKILTTIIASIFLAITGAFAGGLPVIDAAAIAAQHVNAQRDYLEQLIHELNQQSELVKMVQQIEQLDAYLNRFGDPGAIKNLQGLTELQRQLGSAPVLRIPALKSDDLQSGEVFRDLDSRLYPKLEKQIVIDGKVEATRDEALYRPELAERRSQEDYQKVRASVLERRERLRQSHSLLLNQLQQAGTSSEVQKISATLSGLQSELQAVDQELEIASVGIQAQQAANATEKEILRKASVEQERASLRVGTRKDAEIYKLFTTPIHFGTQP